MTAFLKKEWLEYTRSGRLWILLLISAMFGIMNPAIAKLLPWLMEMFSKQLAGAGITAVEVTVDAMASWTQFFKNIPMALIIFVLLCSGSFTDEYERGTLIPVVTKGLSRRKIAAAKMGMLFGLWTLFYGLSLGITYGYNAYFWDNGAARFLPLGTFCFWLFGLWLTGWLVLFSAWAKNSTQVILGVLAVAAGSYVLGFFSALGKFLPLKLMDGMALLQGAERPGDFLGSIIAACLNLFLCIFLTFPCFDRKKL